MTKSTPISNSIRNFNKLQSRYRSLFAEIFHEPANSGFSSIDQDGEFHIHRKMLRRRHVRKEQKEQARRRKEQEEQQASRRLDGLNDEENTTSITDTNSAPWSPSARFKEGDEPRSPARDGLVESISSPPPQTVEYPFLVSPTHDEKLALGRALVATFSPLRSRKRRGDLV